MIVSIENIKSKYALRFSNAFVTIIGSKSCALSSFSPSTVFNNKLSFSRTMYKFCNNSAMSDYDEPYHNIFPGNRDYIAMNDHACCSATRLPRFGSGMPFSYIREHLDDEYY